MDGRLVAHLKPDQFADFGGDVFPGALRDGVELRAYALPRPVMDVGTPPMLERARALARAPR